MIFIKNKIFLDFDGTICDSIEAYCKTYSDIYHKHPNFKIPNPNKVNTWDLKCECPLSLNHVEKIFSHPNFFKHIQFYPYAKKTIEKLSEEYQIIITTIGSTKNLILKSIWIEENLPNIQDLILLKNKGTKMDKSVINMKGAIFIDDHEDNLFGSNAEYKICYSDKVYPWNKNWEGDRVNNWLDLYKILK